MLIACLAEWKLPGSISHICSATEEAVSRPIRRLVSCIGRASNISLTPCRWDPQERRNYGEPIHEDNDILGIFTPEEYTHFKPGWGAVLLGTFVASVFGLAFVVGRFYPDKVCGPSLNRLIVTNKLQPSVTRHFEDGLEAELGGPKAVRARKSEDDWAPLDRS